MASPQLFNLYSEYILRHLQVEEGFKVGGQNITDIRYADDTVLIATSEGKLQALLNNVVMHSHQMGLTLNAKKTKAMVVSRQSDTVPCRVMIENEQVEQVQNFQYLGTWFSSDGRLGGEIRARIAKAKQTFQKMERVLKSTSIKIRIRLRILKSYVWSVLLYGSETWTITQQQKKQLEATEMWFYRRMLKIPWTAHMTNQEVLEKVGCQRELVKLITRRRLQFLGHIIRKDGLEYLMLSGKIEGRRSRGRPRKMFLDNIREELGDDWTASGVIHVARDRDRWKTMVAHVLKHGT